ncbi:citrate transporter [Acidobacteria bacterium AB60]|nr:citrate transporter [Acidobacteria bacterium AB60]
MLSTLVLVGVSLSVALWGALTIAGVLAAIMSRRLSPLAALVLIPVVTSLASGFGLHTSAFILSGIQSMASVISMFVFAILFFGILTDAGMLAPLIHWILRIVGKHPVRIVPGTFLLALLLHLDGSGAVVFLIALPALLPLYDELGIDRRILACAASLAAGVNFLPWTGPTIRAAASLHVSTIALFRPLLPVQIVGLLFAIGVCTWLGLREERRLRPAFAAAPSSAPPPAPRKSGFRFGINVALTLAVLGAAVSGKAEPAVCFMLGTVLGLIVNFPNAERQRVQLEAHAKAAITITAILCAAGCFTGILKGTGMLAAMATACVHALPAQLGHHIPFLLAIIAMPLSLVFDPDSFYFGVLPILATTAGAYGIPSTTVAQAALLGEHTTGFPVSPLTPATFLVTGLSEIDLGEHQRFTGPWLFLASLVMTLAAVAFGIFSF